MNPFAWLKAAKSVPKIADNVFDKDNGLITQMGNWIGNQQYTDQERAITLTKSTDAVINYSIATMGENSDRSKARRKIAVAWIELQIWLIKLAVLSVFMDVLIVELRGGESNIATSINTIVFSPFLWGITGAVSVFFFGTHALRSSKFAGSEK